MEMFLKDILKNASMLPKSHLVKKKNLDTSSLKR